MISLVVWVEFSLLVWPAGSRPYFGIPGQQSFAGHLVLERPAEDVGGAFRHGDPSLL